MKRMKSINLIILVIISTLFIHGCTLDESPVAREMRLERQHELTLARINTGQYQNHRVHHGSLAGDMALAAAVGYAFSPFTPMYAPTFSGGIYYDRNHQVISRTVYETRIKTVEVNKKKHTKNKNADFKKWKSNPKNSQKLAKKAKLKTGSKVAASKKWAGSDKSKPSSWAAAKTSKKPTKTASYKAPKRSSYKAPSRSSYSSSSRRR